MLEKQLRNIADSICDALEIDATVCFDEKYFKDDDPGCAFSVPSANTVFISRRKAKEQYVNDAQEILELSFALAHELRHIWQACEDYEKYFGDHSSELPEEEYNMQLAEIDANAFASCFMILIFEQWKMVAHDEAQEKIDMLCDYFLVNNVYDFWFKEDEWPKDYFDYLCAENLY